MLYLCLIFAAFLHLGDGIRCYQCENYQPGCGDPFDYSTVRSVECDGFGGFGGGQPGFPGQQPFPGGQQQFGVGQQQFGQQGFGQQFGGGRVSSCVKTTMKSGDRWIVTRSCGPPDSGYGSTSESCISQSNSGYRCTCHGDSCNGATKGIALSWLTLALMAAFAFILSR